VDRLPVGLDEGPGLVASVWRYRLLVAVVALLGAAAGFGASTQQAVLYEATSQVLLADPSSVRGLAQPVDPDRYVRNQATFILSPPVLAQAVRLAGGRVTVKELRERLTAEPSQESDLVTVRVRDPTAAGAAQLTNAVGRAYEATAVEQARSAAGRTVQQLRTTESRLRDQLAGLEATLRARPGDTAARVEHGAVADQLAQVVKRAQDLELQAANGNPVALLEPAEVPPAPVQPKPLRLLAAGGLLGLVLAAGLAWWLNSRRQAPSPQPARPEWPLAAPRDSPKAVRARARLSLALRSRLPKERRSATTVVLGDSPPLANGQRPGRNGSGQPPARSNGHANGHGTNVEDILGPWIASAPPDSHQPSDE
jgi:capsular polysaccharide biosynthesis protein